jgi:hypothetical protein
MPMRRLSANINPNPDLNPSVNLFDIFNEMHVKKCWFEKAEPIRMGKPDCTWIFSDIRRMDVAD